MPYAHQPALLLTAPQKASSSSAPQPAAGREHSGSSDKPQGESCHFQKLPHHHQTSRAATWLWGPAPAASGASQTGSTMAWSAVPAPITPRAFGTACCMPSWMLLHLCWVAAFFSCRVSLVVSLLWTPVARTPQAGPRPLSLGGSTSAHPLAFHALFCPLVSCVIAICSSLGQKLFSRMFFARLPLQQDCNLNQRSSNVIKKLLHKWELQPQWM